MDKENKKLSESQKRADDNWRKNNKEHANYLRARSAARSFIRTKANKEDLSELLELIKEKMSELNK